MRVSDEPVVIERTFDATADAVWKAITELDRMRQWYFENIPSFEPEVGFRTQFSVRSGERDFVHVWTVTEAVPRKRIAYEWRYEGLAGDSTVVWELTEEGEATRLRLAVEVREDFPDEIPEFRRESCVAGWEYFIGERLKGYLDKS